MESTEVSPAGSLDVQAIRDEFPILARPLRKGRALTFLDSAASAQKPRSVIEKEREAYENYYANAYRGVYEFGARIDDELEATRSKVASLIQATSSEEIIFTPGTTMAINTVAFGWGRRNLSEGDEILLNPMEHHANLVPWQVVAQQTGARCRHIPLTDDGRLDMDRLDEVLTDRTKMVAVSAMSNVLGTINPVQELAELAHRRGARILVDAAQSVPHDVCSVQDWGVDFLAFSGHKIYGPSGVGVLYAPTAMLDETDPFVFGGHMIERVELESSTWAAPPAKFEAGTIPIAQAIALGTAVDFVTQAGLEAIHAHESQLLSYTHEQLSTIPGMKR